MLKSKLSCVCCRVYLLCTWVLLIGNRVDDVIDVHRWSFPREKSLTVILCCWWSLPSLPVTSEHNVAACPRSRSFWLKLRVGLLHSEDDHLTASIYEPFIHKAVDMIKDNIILIVRAEFGVQALVVVNRHEWVIHAWLPICRFCLWLMTRCIGNQYCLYTCHSFALNLECQWWMT